MNFVKDNFESDRELWHKWVEPHYLYLKGYRWLNPGSNLSKPPFVIRVNLVLGDLTESIVEDLLFYHNWRHQLTGSWFAGVKGWSQYTHKIGSYLGGYYSQMGVCFALACFGNDLSIDYLSRYLEEYSMKQVKFDFWDNHHLSLAIGALIYLDRDLGYKYSQKFYLKEENSFNQKGQNSLIIEKQRQVFQKMIDFKSKWF